MAEFGLLGFRISETTLQTVGLIGVEIADRRHFEPTLLGFAVDLEVIADSAGERLVAATEQKYAIGQLQFLEQTFLQEPMAK